MDQGPAGDTSSETSGGTAHVSSGPGRRRRMREQARGLRPTAPAESDGFRTPQWLDRSFVLPVNGPETGDVPSQPTPHHDDYETEPAEAVVVEPVDAEAALPVPEEPPAFVRPPTPEIDFARVIQRSDRSRAATRTALAATALAGLLLVVHLLVGSAVVLGMALAFAIVAAVATVARLRLVRAGVPHLDR